MPSGYASEGIPIQPFQMPQTISPHELFADTPMTMTFENNNNPSFNHFNNTQQSGFHRKQHSRIGGVSVSDVNAITETDLFYEQTPLNSFHSSTHSIVAL